MKHTYLLKTLLSALAIGTSVAAFAAPAEPTCLNGRMEGFGQTPAIHVEGNKLMDDCGNQVVLHGVMDTPNGYFNGNFSRWAFDWGKGYDAPTAIPNVKEYFNKIFTVLGSQDKGVYCNVFRLHMDPCWTNDPNIERVGEGGEHNISQFSAQRLKYFLENLYFPLAKEAIKHGMYVIMRPPGVCPQKIKVGDDYNNYLKTVWDIVSSNDSIKKYEGVISIELANEPVQLFDKNGTETAQAPWAPRDFFQPVLDVIRKNGYKGIVWGAGTGYQSQYGGYKDYPLVDPLKNLGYACHVYTGWYGNADEYGNTNQFIEQFKKQVPVVETNPIVVTECDWSPGHVVGTNFDGSLKSENLGTWATGSTSKWGVRFKAVMDKYNLSLTLTGTDDYVDMEHYLKTGEIRYAFYGKEGAEDACGKACWDWYAQYAKVNYPQFCKPVDPTPYKGVAAVIPGRIEAENYDEGGKKSGYYDLSDGNECDEKKNVYRSDDVDIKETEDGYALGSCQEGEWLRYSVNVQQEGDYIVKIKVGEGNDYGKLSLKMDDGSINEMITVDSTGAWGTWAEQLLKGTFHLKAGRNALYMTIEKDWVDIDWIDIQLYDPSDVADIENFAEIKSVEYISPLGVVSDKPYDGMNIVRTVYTDGDIAYSKRVIRVYK